MAGQVIGMNTAIYTQSMGSQGVGFAMPSNVIASVYNMLIGPDHKVIRGSIGISFQSTPPSSAVGRVYGFANGGVLVNTVNPPTAPPPRPESSPATSSSPSTASPSRMATRWSPTSPPARSAPPSSSAYMRNGKPPTVTVGIADRAKLFAGHRQRRRRQRRARPRPTPAEGKLGIKVAAIPPRLASKLGIKGGVIVTTVRPGSFADEIGLAKGTIIVAINKQPVTDEATYRAIVTKLKPHDDVVFVVNYPQHSGNTFSGERCNKPRNTHERPGYSPGRSRFDIVLKRGRRCFEKGAASAAP